MEYPLIPPNPILGVQYYTVFAIIWQRQLIHNYYANRTPLPPNKSYDFIIVGAGSAGSIVACRLSQRGKNVLLLEAGGAQDALLTDHPQMKLTQLAFGGDRVWPYYNEPQRVGTAYANSRINEPKGKMLGGTSSLNFMLYIRGNRKDYDNLVETYGAYGWSYDELLPLFKRTENNSNYHDQYHGNSGPMGVRYNPGGPGEEDKALTLFNKAVNELGYPTVDGNGPSQIGVNNFQYNIKNGLRSGTANAFLESGICPKLTIVTRALVSKVLIQNVTNGLPFASGVEFLKEGKTYCVNANKEVIISAGPIASPQILMLSGIGPKNHLKEIGISPIYADLSVGDNHCNHLCLINNAIMRDYSFVSLSPAFEVQQMYQANVLGIGILSRPQHNFFFRPLPSGEDWPDTNTECITSKNGGVNFPMIYEYGENVEQWTQYLNDLNKMDYLSIFPTLLRPKSRGTIRLRSNNITDLPIINPNFLAHPSDWERFREEVAYSFYIVEATSFSKYAYVNPTPIPGCSYCPDRPVYKCKSYLDCLIEKSSTSLVHPVGGVMMGDPSRSYVVVDPRLRVKGIRGLRVIDSSIYAECINANTNAASMLAGEKGADLLTQDYP